MIGALLGGGAAVAVTAGATGAATAAQDGHWPWRGFLQRAGGGRFFSDEPALGRPVKRTNENR